MTHHGHSMRGDEGYHRKNLPMAPRPLHVITRGQDIHGGDSNTHHHIDQSFKNET